MLFYEGFRSSDDKGIRKSVHNTILDKHKDPIDHFTFFTNTSCLICIPKVWKMIEDMLLGCELDP